MPPSAGSRRASSTIASPAMRTSSATATRRPQRPSGSPVPCSRSRARANPHPRICFAERPRSRPCSPTCTGRWRFISAPPISPPTWRRPRSNLLVLNPIPAADDRRPGGSIDLLRRVRHGQLSVLERQHVAGGIALVCVAGPRDARQRDQVELEHQVGDRTGPAGLVEGDLHLVPRRSRGARLEEQWTRGVGLLSYLERAEGHFAGAGAGRLRADGQLLLDIEIEVVDLDPAFESFARGFAFDRCAVATAKRQIGIVRHGFLDGVLQSNEPSLRAFSLSHLESKKGAPEGAPLCRRGDSN